MAAPAADRQTMTLVRIGASAPSAGNEDVGAAQEASTAQSVIVGSDAVRSTSPTRPSVTLGRSSVWGTTLLIGGLLSVSGQPLAVAPLCLMLTVMAASVLAAPRGLLGLSLVSALPAGFVVVVAYGIAFGLASTLVGLDAWSSRSGGLVGLALFSLLCGLLARRRGGRVDAWGPDMAALVGSVMLLGYWLTVIVTQPLAVWSRISSSGTDFLRHLAGVSAVRDTGSLRFGESAYPGALNGLGAWITSAMDLPQTASSLWRAVAPLSMLMLTLILLAIMSIAGRLTYRVLGRGAPAHIAAVLSGIAFIQTAWFSTFLSFGMIMNMLVGLVLVGLLLSGLQAGLFGSTTGTVVCACSLSVTANAWQLLLPVVGIAAIPWIIQFVRRGRHRVTDWVIWGVGAVCAVHGLLGLRGQESTGLLAIPTVSNLFRPDWWWGLAAGLAVVAIVLGFSRGLRTWAVMALGALLMATLLVAAMILITGSTWELMRYYPVKTLWTSMILVIPLAASGGVCLAAGIWIRSSGRSNWLRLASRGGLALVVGLFVLSVLGRGAAFPPHLVTMAGGRAGPPNWSLALVESMTGVTIPESSHQGAVVFGLVPAGDARTVGSGFAGMVDYMAMESLRFLGIEGPEAAPVKFGLYARDMTQVCRYLKDYPDSLRLTGPNPEAGAPWIIASGCPADVVQPARWISLKIDPVWFERSPWADGQWRFPTFDEVQGASLRG